MKEKIPVNLKFAKGYLYVTKNKKKCFIVTTTRTEVKAAVEGEETILTYDRKGKCKENPDLDIVKSYIDPQIKRLFNSMY